MDDGTRLKRLGEADDRQTGAEAGGADLTGLLLAWSAGDRNAAERLLSAVYDELHLLARRSLRKRPGQTLQTTALVNEAYLRLIDQRVEWRNRSHFFALAAHTMRRIAVDHGRRRQAQKRGSGGPRISLAGFEPASTEPAFDALALDDALRRLERVDRAKASVVELRFFGGLKVREVAEVLGCSKATVERHWEFARAWLYRELR